MGSPVVVSRPNSFANWDWQHYLRYTVLFNGCNVILAKGWFLLCDVIVPYPIGSTLRMLTLLSIQYSIPKLMIHENIYFSSVFKFSNCD